MGASGNVGTAVVRALAGEPRVDAIVGVARRRPEWTAPKTQWVAADLSRDDLEPVVRGADVVVHLAWLFQPTHEPYVTWETNVIGTARLLDAIDRADVPALVYASSVGAYSPKIDDQPVDEGWPTHGWPTAAYGREKAYVERLVDAHVATHPDRRVVRLRPAFIFQETSALQQRRLFAGRLLPTGLVRRDLIPVLPWPRGLRFQALHAADAGEAYLRAVVEPARGIFNVAADPIITGHVLADHLGARLVDLPPRLVRSSMAGAWQAHLMPASPDLFEMARRLPIMSTRRAADELGWSPRHSAVDALDAFLTGLRRGTAAPTPPLAG